MTSAPPPRPKPHTARWWIRLRRDRWFWLALTGLGILTALILIGPPLTPYTESEQNLAGRFAKPLSGSHLFGSDALGRDLFTRVLLGGRISLAVGLFGATASLIIGVIVGGFAGLLGGWPERITMRFIDFMTAIPFLLIVIALMVLIDSRGLISVFIALGLVFWLQMARVVRARVAELRSREFIEAARALGAGRVRLFFTHILPNCTGVIVVTATFMVPQAIFAESYLSFLGLGVSDPHASWGTLANDGLAAMQSNPHVLAFPAIAICLTIFLFQSLGEALRNAIDPKQASLD